MINQKTLFIYYPKKNISSVIFIEIFEVNNTNNPYKHLLINHVARAWNRPGDVVSGQDVKLV